MPADVTALVLLAALMHAGWNLLVKGHSDRLMMMVMVAGGGSLLAIPLLPFTPVLSVAAWPFLGLSLTIHIFYKLFLLQAYRHGDLNQAYPLARGGAPLLVLVFALLFAGEEPDWPMLLATLLIGLGVTSLAFRNGRLDATSHLLFYALGTSIFIAIYTVTDGMGARAAGNPHSYAIYLFAFDGFAIILIAWWRRRSLFWPAIMSAWKPGLAGGAMSMAAYWLVIWALSHGAMAPVSALRETSVVIAALLGSWFLKEPAGRHRLMASIMVASGIVVLKL